MKRTGEAAVFNNAAVCLTHVFLAEVDGEVVFFVCVFCVFFKEKTSKTTCV